MSQAEDEKDGRADISIEPSATTPAAADAVVRRPARVIDGDLARLIAEGAVGTAEVLGMAEDDVLRGIWDGEEAVIAQIDDYLRKDNAQSRRGGEYKAWEAKYPPWVAWRERLTVARSSPHCAAELKATVAREAQARKRAELLNDAATYLRDRHLEWSEDQKMRGLAAELGLGDADVEWAYAELQRRRGFTLTRADSPESGSAAPAAPAAPAPVPATEETWGPRIAAMLEVAEEEQDPIRKSEFLFKIGKLYRDKTKDAERAIELFEKALDLNPNYLLAFENLFYVLAARGDWSAVERAFRRMLRRVSTENVAPGGASGDADLELNLWHNLGLIYRDRLADPVSAAEAFKMAARRKSGRQ